MLLRINHLGRDCRAAAVQPRGALRGSAAPSGRERRPRREQRPGERVGEVAGVADRVNQQRAKAAAIPIRAGDELPRSPSSRDGRPRRSRGRSERIPESRVQRATASRARVGGEPDRPLLGRDRDRLVVGDRVVALLHVLLLARTPSRTRPTRSRRPAGRAGQLDTALIRCCGPRLMSRAFSFEPPAAEDGQRGADRRGVAIAAQRRLQRSAASTAMPREQGDEAGLGEGEDRAQRRSWPATDQGEGEACRPSEDAEREQDAQRHQVAPVDVRVPEERVDPEVEVEVVGHLQSVVPEDLLAANWPIPTSEKMTASPRTTPKASRSSRGVPGTCEQEREHHGERDQEEADVARREADVVGVDRPDGVEATAATRASASGRGQRAGEAGPPSAARRPSAQVTPPPDHRVERHQQVDVLPAPETRSGSGRAAPRPAATAAASASAAGSPRSTASATAAAAIAAAKPADGRADRRGSSQPCPATSASAIAERDEHPGRPHFRSPASRATATAAAAAMQPATSSVSLMRAARRAWTLSRSPEVATRSASRGRAGGDSGRRQGLTRRCPRPSQSKQCGVSSPSSG